MERRTFLIAGTVTLGVGLAGGALWLQQRNPTEHLSLAKTVKQLSQLNLQEVASIGQWSPTQIFTHLAQSIEMSVSGFPEHKSELFKDVIGRNAFQLFSRKGYMKHGLAEPIPGAPELTEQANAEQARQRLLAAITNFQRFEEVLSPHFAYGVLSKSEYELAHVMHIDDHLTELVTA